MKTFLLFGAVLFTTFPAFGEQSFPGLKQILSEAEWNRSGLSRLSPDELGVIDAALIRYQGRTETQHKAELAEVRAAIPATPSTEHRPSLLERFGLSDVGSWRDIPPMQAKVVAWMSANRFKLDNGQIWEGFDPIPYELVGKDIEIAPRPHGMFALVVDGKSTTVHLKRVY